MAIVGLIPFVYAAIKRKRRSTARAADLYAGLATGGTAARGHEHARGAYQSQSCHFSVRPSLDDELGLSYDFDSAARRPPAKDLSWELFPADRCERLAATGAPCAENARVDGRGLRAQSCRFAVRASPVDGLVVSREEVASRRLPAQPDGLSRQLLRPASRHDTLATGAAREQEHARSKGSAYQFQSCRFTVHHAATYEHGLSHEEYCAASTSPQDLSGKTLLPAGQSERGVSRSLRFSSMRVFAWVSGA